MAMWASPMVLSFRSISIEAVAVRPGFVAAGHVMSDLDQAIAVTEYGMWRRLVIMLAGAAAEAQVFGGSIGHYDDAQTAHDLSEELALRKFEAPAFEWSGPAFKLPIMDGSAKSIALTKTAFVAAWKIVEVFGLKFDRVVQLLLTRRTLRESDVEEVLGSRLASKFFWLIEILILDLGAQAK